MRGDSQGISMWWFRRPKRTEIWDEQIQWPIDDISAAQRIRDICRSAAADAGTTAALAADGSNAGSHESDRYKRAAKVAMEIALRISDDLMRDASVREIVDLCMSANDLKTSQILFRAIQAVSVREEVLNQHPTLRQ